MLKPVVMKNPGCQFCRYYLPPFAFEQQMTTAACLKGARKIVQQRPCRTHPKGWKWTGCSYATEKNRDRRCADFMIASTTRKILHQLSLWLTGAKKQYPPAFSGEIWWET
jgi:hypothetical protein